jgi:hypothetical protein
MMTDSDKSGKVIENKKRSDRNYKIFDGSVYAYANFGYRFVYAHIPHTYKFQLTLSKSNYSI